MPFNLPSLLPHSLPVLGRRADSRGFTLIEIISVLVLLGILAAVVANKSFDNNGAEVSGEIEVVKGYLRFAQIRAMNSSTSWGILFAGNSYTLQNNGGASTVPLPGQNTATYNLPTGTVSSSINPVVFNQWGDPGANITVTVTVGANSQTFTITQITGFIP